MKKKLIEYFESGDTVRIINGKQAAFYWGVKGIAPLRIYPSTDLKTGSPIIAYVFSIEDTKEAYKEWQESRPTQS